MAAAQGESTAPLHLKASHAKALAETRNLMFKRMTCHRCEANRAPPKQSTELGYLPKPTTGLCLSLSRAYLLLMCARLPTSSLAHLACYSCPSSQTSLVIGTLPFLFFASGHTFFTQSLQERMGFLPVCVHTTFQFGDTAEFTWGKRSRLREKRLWAVDDDGYYRRQGAGSHPAEATYEGFLLLSGELLDLTQLKGKPLSRNEASSAVKVEGNPKFVERSLATTHDDVINTMPDRNPNRHLLIDAVQRRLVHGAMALGRAMRRKVIMPKMWCWCDRFWNPMTNCRMPGNQPGG